MNLSSKKSSNFETFKKKIIKYKFIKIINPPISDVGFLCFFNNPSGLSKNIKFLDRVSNFKKIIKLNIKIKIDKKIIFIYVRTKF